MFLLYIILQRFIKIGQELVEINCIKTNRHTETQTHTHTHTHTHRRRHHSWVKSRNCQIIKFFLCTCDGPFTYTPLSTWPTKMHIDAVANESPNVSWVLLHSNWFPDPASWFWKTSNLDLTSSLQKPSSETPHVSLVLHMSTEPWAASWGNSNAAHKEYNNYN